MMLAVGLLKMPFTGLRKFTSTASLLRVWIMNWYWILLNAFSACLEIIFFFFVYEYGELYGLVFKCWTNLEFLKWNLTSCIVLVFLYITGFYLLFSIFFICISFFSPHFFHSLLLIEYFLISSFSLLSWLIYTSQNF